MHRSEVPGVPIHRLRGVVQDYTQDLDELLKGARRANRARLIEELHNRLTLLDAQVAATMEAGDPAFRQISSDLRASSEAIMRESSDLETRNWERVQKDHDRARLLLWRAEWVMSVISFITLLVSIWVSFILPRTVVEPLVALKAAVDHAAAGNYAIEFDVEGDGEVARLANSVRDLVAHVREKDATARQSSKP